MQKFLIIFIISFSYLVVQKSFAQIATNDLLFNSSDIGFGKGDGPNGLIYSTTALSDGKILVAGSFTYYNQKVQGRIMRLDKNGNIDPAFLTGTGFNADVNTMLVQPDGKILAGGSFGLYNGQTVIRIARLNADGTLDGSFNPGTGPNNLIRDIALQSDGKIIIAGNFTSYNGVNKNYIARLNADGSLDASFNTATGPDLWINKLALQGDGKIIIGGQFSNVNGKPTKYIARLNEDGSLDESFTVGTGFNQPVSALALQSDNKILIGGKFTLYNNATAEGICRLNSDGTRDASFTTSTQEVLVIKILTDNKILIGGNFNIINSVMSYASLARLNSDGSVDASFSPIPAATISSLAVQSDGQLLAGGTFPSVNGLSRARLVLLQSDGNQDLTFNVGTGADNFINVVTVLPDDKIMIGGAFNYYNGKPRNHIARLNADGTLDETFDPGAGTDGVILAITVQPDGKIIIGGQFFLYNGTIRRCITRLNADGSLDETFNPSGLGITGTYVNAILLQNDGKIVLGGNFTKYNNLGTGSLVRITSTGEYDPTFTSEISNANSVQSLVMQMDGKIIIAGKFSTYGGISRNNIARINSNGSLDASFNPGLGTNNQIESVVLQSDQKIIAGGVFTSFDGAPVNHLVRLNADGSKDASFNAGDINSTMSVVSLFVQSDDKVLVTGYFTSYDSHIVGSFARLNTDGTLDVNFIANTGADNSTYAVGLQSDGKIILGGAFAGFNSTGRNRITRLLTTPCTPPAITTTTPASICGAGSATLNATASEGTVNWYTAANGGEPFTSGNAFVTPLLNSSVTYYVETIVDGCPSGRTAVTATINDPQVTLVSGAGRCDAGTVTLSATGNTGSTLKWYDVLTEGTLLETGPSFTTPVISSSTNYYVEASIGSCIVAPRRQVKATVNITPTIVSTVPGRVCGSGKAVLQANVIGGSVRWYSQSIGGTSLSSLASFTTPTISSPVTYYVDAISGGCVTERVEVEALVDNMPVITSTTPGSRCGTGSVNLQAVSDIGTLDWYTSTSGGISLGTGTTFVTPSLSNGKNYYVSASNGACVTSRSSVEAIIYPALNTTLTVSGSIITATETDASYQWLDCGDGNSLIDGETNQSFTAITDGAYSVSISKNGCTATSNCISVLSTDILSSDLTKEILITPNPGNGVFNIQTKGSIQNITITAITGVTILNKIPDISSTTLDMSNHPDGMYFIHLKIGEQIYTSKFMLLR